MAETVLDIPGKGFKYEQRVVVTTFPNAALQTVAAGIGVASWGPINTPTLIVGNEGTLKAAFGPSLTSPDSTTAALEYFLKKSNAAYFTRIADGSESPSTLQVDLAATAASIYGNKVVKNKSYNITSSGTFTISGVTASGTVTGITVPVAVSSQATPLTSDNDFTAVTGTAGNTTYNYAVGEVIKLSIDGITATHVVTAASPFAQLYSTSASGFYNLSGTYASGATFADAWVYAFNNTTDFNAFPAGVASVSGTGFVAFKSLTKYGKQSYVRIDSDGTVTKLFSTSKTFPILHAGADTTASSLIAAFDSAVSGGSSGMIRAALSTSTTQPNGVIQFYTTSAGAVNHLEIYGITGNTTVITSQLGITDSVGNGSAAVSNIFAAEAAYTGQAGDTVKLIFGTGNRLDVTFQGINVQTFKNISFDASSSAYFLNSLKNSTKIAKVLNVDPSKLTHVDGQVIIPGSYTLANGENGDGNGTISSDYYVTAIGEYKNLDLYDIDLIFASGRSDSDIINALNAVCEYRMDCFAVIDTPFLTTVDDAVRWHNGVLPGSGITSPIDSRYLVTFFPWLDRKVNGIKNEWVAPSTLTVGAIAQSDQAIGDKLGAPAGRRTKFDSGSIEALQLYLSQEERDQLYADENICNINPLRFTSSDGYFIDGQKTMQREQNALNRIDTLRTSLWIKRNVALDIERFFWAPIDAGTYQEFSLYLSAIMDRLVGKRRVRDDGDFKYKVEVTTVNDEQTKAALGLIGAITWSPIKSVERIKVISTIQDEQVTFIIQ